VPCDWPRQSAAIRYNLTVSQLRSSLHFVYFTLQLVTGVNRVVTITTVRMTKSHSWTLSWQSWLWASHTFHR